MSNLISITKKKEDEENEETVGTSEETAEKAKEDYDFESTMKKNQENRKRAADERRKANKGVIRSYKLKH